MSMAGERGPGLAHWPARIRRHQRDLTHIRRTSSASKNLNPAPSLSKSLAPTQKARWAAFPNAKTPGGPAHSQEIPGGQPPQTQKSIPASNAQGLRSSTSDTRFSIHKSPRLATGAGSVSQIFNYSTIPANFLANSFFIGRLPCLEIMIL